MPYICEAQIKKALIMSKRNLLFCLICLVFTPGTVLFAGENAMDAFIHRIKQTNAFVPVNTIWHADNNFDKSALLKVVEDAQPLSIDYMQVAMFMKQKNTAITLTVPGIGGGTYTLDLARYDFLTNDFQVHEVGENNSDKVVPYTPGLYYRGVVRGMKGSMVAFSFFNNEIYGIFSIPDEGNFVLVPNTMVGNYYDYNQHYILYNDAKILHPEMLPGCETDMLPERNEPAEKTTTFLNNKVYNNCKEVRVMEVGDYSTYQAKGNSTTNVVNFLTALFNNQSTIYRNEGIPTVMKYVQVNTATDIYQAVTSAQSIRFLRKFGWQTKNVLNGCDLALLFSAKFNSGYGALGGVAWLRSMCNSYSSWDSSGPYGYVNISNSGNVNFPTYSSNVMVPTHEMGHIIGSPHTHACCWNPPARNTAIDKCYNLEGSCPDPSPLYPAGGGTIMSYCHLVSGVGSNFSKGFGTQPGDTIRRFLSNKFSGSCGEVFFPTTSLSAAGRTITANRECTDIAGGIATTYYWKDNSSASHDDDTLVLMVIKNGNNIGNLDTTGFAVTTGTITGYGGGTGIAATFPAGTAGVGTSGINYAMRRYWSITPTGTAAITTPVEVIFPFRATDTADVSGSVPGATPISSYRMYKVSNPIDPNPANSFTSAVPSNFTVYTNGAASSTTNWALSTSGTTYFASMKMTNVAGGGTGFYPSSVISGIESVQQGAAPIYIYPNPTSNEWNISTMEIGGNGHFDFRLYTSDGREVSNELLQAGTIHTINAANLPAGVYYYRIIGEQSVYTGSLMRN
jgi:hypothetical protein